MTEPRPQEPIGSEAPAYPAELIQALSEDRATGAQLVHAYNLGLVKIGVQSWWLSVAGEEAVRATAAAVPVFAQ